MIATILKVKDMENVLTEQLGNVLFLRNDNSQYMDNMNYRSLKSNLKEWVIWKDRFYLTQPWYRLLWPEIKRRLEE